MTPGTGVPTPPHPTPPTPPHPPNPIPPPPHRRTALRAVRYGTGRGVRFRLFVLPQTQRFVGGGGSLAPLRLKCEVSQNLIRTTFFGLRTGPFELQVSAMKSVDLQAADRSLANVAPPVRGENDLYRLLVDGFQSSRNLLNSKVYDSLGIPAAGLAGPGCLSRRPGNFKRPQLAATSGSQERLRF